MRKCRIHCFNFHGEDKKSNRFSPAHLDAAACAGDPMTRGTSFLMVSSAQASSGAPNRTSRSSVSQECWEEAVGPLPFTGRFSGGAARSL